MAPPVWVIFSWLFGRPKLLHLTVCFFFVVVAFVIILVKHPWSSLYRLRPPERSTGYANQPVFVSDLEPISQTAKLGVEKDKDPVLPEDFVYRAELDAQVERRNTGQACVHPKLSLARSSDPSGTLTGRAVPDANCSAAGAANDWVYIWRGRFRLSKAAVKKYGKIQCSLRPVLWKTDFEFFYDEELENMEDGDLLPSEFVKVFCTSKGGLAYDNYHAGAVRSDEILKRLKQYARWSKVVNKVQKEYDIKLQNLQTNKKILASRLGGSNKGLGLSVFILGIGSVSRMSWLRYLPLTRKYFAGKLGGIEMEGYNTLAGGTPWALFPILTGQMMFEIPEARRGFPEAKSLDNCPWLWKSFSKHGHVTAFGEEQTDFGAFQHQLLGFKKKPTDHYLRTFQLAAAHMHNKKAPFCQGSLPSHKVIMNWCRELFDLYRARPKFFFAFMSKLSQANSRGLLQTMDKDLLGFLQDLEDRNHLNRTLLILLSDHGPHFEQLRSATPQERLEERLPYLALRFPPWFAKQHPDIVGNIRTNAKRLTTPLDIHRTLTEILDFPSSGVADLGQRRALSLFREIPQDRSCEDAEVTPHWCGCLSWTFLAPSDPLVHAAARSVVEEINQLTSGQRRLCSQLRLLRVLHAYRFTPSKKDVRATKKVLDYQTATTTQQGSPLQLNFFPRSLPSVYELYHVAFVTQPGNGHFEATCQHVDPVAGLFKLDLSRDVSRSNKYGNDTHCVLDKYPHLLPFCHCS